MPCFAGLSIVATFWLLGGSSKCGFKNWWTTILLMSVLRVIALCVFTIIFDWIKISLSEGLGCEPLFPCRDCLGIGDVTVQTLQWARAQITSDSAMPPLHKPVRAPWTVNWVFSEVTGAFYSHSPHSSRSRMGWVTVPQASSSIRYFFALQVAFCQVLEVAFDGCSSQGFLALLDLFQVQWK